MVVDPAVIAVTNPDAFTVPTLVFEELQLAEPVRFSDVPSLKVPVAVNCCVVPAVTDPFPGVSWRALRLPSTNMSVLPEIEPELAVIEAEPCPPAVARPEVPTVTTEVWDDDQVAELVRSCVLPSLKLPVAVNCTDCPIDNVGLPGVTCIDVNVGGPPPVPALLLNAAKTTAHGKVDWVAVNEDVPVTLVPAAATAWYSSSPVGPA